MAHGTLTMIVGCMFAEKTTELIRLYRRVQRAGRQCIMVKPGKDTRYSKSDVVSHNQESETALVCQNSMEIMDIIGENEYVFFDEGQFFDDLAKTCDLLMQKGIHIYVSALRSDFRRNPFPVVSTLLARANGGIIWLTAVCACGKDATESKLIANVDLNGTSEFIGGGESYAPVCLGCFWKTDHLQLD